FHTSPWQASVTRAEYQAAFARIKEYIAGGDTYQVNYTWRLNADFTGDPWGLFHALYQAQRPCYGGYLDIGAHVLCSASPELFFTRHGEVITCRPMKGTIERGLWYQQDQQHAAQLLASAKERAENLMIVDMVRNDLGRIAMPGQVAVPRLFTAEQYDTLWQLTSSVTAHSSATLPALFRALFPCASITGAPKIRTSQIITELETTPRGVYTGCIGFVAPGGDAQFNVAIRTAHLARRTGRVEYGVGSGVTWDSTCTGEYQECRTKALLLSAHRPAFQLLETLLWKPEIGYFLLQRHLQRLGESARYFGIPLESGVVEAKLQAYTATFPAQRQRVRCLIDANGNCTLEAQPIAPAPVLRWRLALAPAPIDPGERLLYHKTTWRVPYEQARAASPEADDVLLWNPVGELTESTIANVVVRSGGRLLTPPVHCGLLAGTYRDHLIASGRIVEEVISVDELSPDTEIYLLNSVRGWVPAKIVR
ncbi:MAG: aminodeoxychorismate synthase component I, partial [bacterium]